ncbi:MAG: DNA methyltransferase [Acidobacteriota bacterium]|nr:DNA methyltransferase [Acidobacteriota bacterium]
MSMQRADKVHSILTNLKSLDKLKELFWTELNYEQVNQTLSRRNWNTTATEALDDDPLLLAAAGMGNGFHVIYCRLADDRLHYSKERPVVARLMNDHQYALFIFSDRNRNSWHFINTKYDDEPKRRRLFRRISVQPGDRLRTASERLSLIDIESIGKNVLDLSPLEIQKRHDEAFDVESVTKEFYRGYESVFRALEKTLLGQDIGPAHAHDYALQFLNRTMFLYFIQRKRWLADDTEFLGTFWESYRTSSQPADSFVEKWLNVLFFEAFNQKSPACHRHFPPKINKALALAPYLNGGLYAENKLDQTVRANITDSCFAQIFSFFERYNFTITEDSPLDKEIAVDPEMIGKVYESLVNVSAEIDARGEAGIFYTPRTEIDLMCRLSLSDYLSNHLPETLKDLLNSLVFSLYPDDKADADKSVTNAGIWPRIKDLLGEVTVLDPACGSGSFLVGMLHILDDLIERANRALNISDDPFTRKKKIIGESLYGVDVMEWACHVAELRLWLAMIADYKASPGDLRFRNAPLLPHFSFKIRCGDSLVQEVGGINFSHRRSRGIIPKSFENRIDLLKSEKIKFFNNVEPRKLRSLDDLRIEERRLFLEILESRKSEIHRDIDSTRQVSLRVEENKALFGSDVGEPDPYPVSEDETMTHRIEDLEAEYETASRAYHLLRGGGQAPFVWDIAFCEIFRKNKNGFDIVIGNPPYVRQEDIAAPTVQGLKVTPVKKEYKGKIAQAVYRAFEKFFGFREKTQSVKHKIDAKSDLYIYFFFIGLSLLNPKGSFCFVTSNSWLDVGYGKDLQEFLLKHAHVKFILDNQLRRSFEGADINTIIALISFADDAREWGLDKTARFVMFRVPYELVISPVIIDELEESHKPRTIQEYRVFPILQSRLLEDGSAVPGEDEAENRKAVGPLIKVARYIGNKWGGKYLRAPDIYWTIMEKGRDKLVRLGEVAEVRFGIKTGANEFFYLNDSRIHELCIEPEFLKQVIKSPRECKRILIDPADLKFKIFFCHKNKEELKGTAALEYIKWGESKKFHLRPSCSNRARWWDVGERRYAPIISPSSVTELPRTFLNSHQVLADKRLYEIYPKIDTESVLFATNTILCSLFLELGSRTGLGEGLLDLTVYELADCLIIPPSSTPSILEILTDTEKREILPLRQEIANHNRKQIDEIVFDILQLTKDERSAVCEAVINLVESRLQKAQSL